MLTVSRRELAIVIVCLIASALVIDFGTIHGCHTSDSIVMPLVSLYQWTPLCWEMDRLGMVFPLLATPWRHPLDNLLAQGAMTTLAGLACAFLLGWYTVGPRRGIAVGALCGVFLVVFCRIDQQFEFFITLQQHAQALAIGLAGLLLLANWGRGGAPAWRAIVLVFSGVLCLAAAHWINPALAFVLGPLVIVRGLCFRDLPDRFEAIGKPSGTVPIFRRAPSAGGSGRKMGLSPSPRRFSDRPLAQDDMARATGGDEPRCMTGGNWRQRAWPTLDEVVALVAIAASMAGSMALSRLTAEPKGYHLMPLGESIACAAAMWHKLSVYFHHRWFSAVEITAAIGLVTLCWPAGRRAARASLPLVAGLIVVAAVQYAWMSSLDHVRDNHSARYVILSVLVWQAALVGFAVIQVDAVIGAARWSRVVPAILALLMTCTAVTCHGWPSTAMVRAELDRTLGRYSDDILATRCTHVTGDYWHVWTAMFHVNMRLADAGESRTVWGIAYRSHATEDQWRQVPWQRTRIAEIVGDEAQSAEFRGRYRVPSVEQREARGMVRVLTPTAPWEATGEIAAQTVERN